jgi:hypothetical protein
MMRMRPQACAQVTIACGLLALALCAPAGAGTRTTTNACLYSVNDEYRDQLVTLTGSGSPVGAAAGATATLSGASVSAALPPSLPKTGYDLGIFRAGQNLIPSKVWLAIAAAGAAPATQVQELSVTASTTIKVGAGGNFVSGTPIVVKIPLPDTTWTVDGSAPVAFSQAGPGTLPSLPVGLNDQVVPVAGSIVVKPTLGSLRFLMDCQPGSTAAPFKTFAPAIAAPFATLDADDVVAPAPAPAAPRVTSTKLKLAGSRTAVVVACPAGVQACKGRIALRSRAPVRIGGRSRILTVAPVAGYDVAAGARKTVALKLGSAARTVMRKRRTLRVRVTLTPASGAAVTRDLTLQR